MAKGVKSQALSIYLGKATTQKLSDLADEKNCKTYDVALGDLTGKLLVPISKSGRPKWADFLQAGVRERIDVGSMSAAGLLAVRIKGRWFALAFGHARHKLLPGSCEQGFGLRVCLNCIEPLGLRSIDRRTFEAGVRQGREQVSRDSDISAFGLNIEQDMLRAVTGAPRATAKLGTRISGMDALSIHSRTSLDGLPKLLERLLDFFNSHEYRKQYPWVDHIDEVRDDAKAEALDERLVEMLKNSSDGVWMAIPEIVDWFQIDHFSHSIDPKSLTFRDLHTRTLREHLYKSGAWDIATLRRTRVYQFSTSDQRIRRTWSAYECLYAEADVKGMHVLSGGRWYKIDSDYASAVKASIRSIPKTNLQLPEAKNGEREGDYNTRAAKAIPGSILLDGPKHLVQLATHVDKIEICDILHPASKTFLHVKKWGQSAVLSHLFAQGFVSADLFLHNPKFREAARKTLGAALMPIEKPDAGQYEVAFALISSSDKEIRLPFFSQVSLRACVDNLRGRGYRVSLTKIQAT